MTKVTNEEVSKFAVELAARTAIRPGYFREIEITNQGSELYGGGLNGETLKNNDYYGGASL